MGFLALKNFHSLMQLSKAKPCALLLLEAITHTLQRVINGLVRTERHGQDLWDGDWSFGSLSAT